MKKNRNLKGMTLVECIIAMCVLGAIAGMFVTVAVKAKNMNTQNYKRSNTMYKQAAAAENFNTNVKYGMDCRVSKMITGGATNKVTMDANFGSIDLETEAYGYTAKRTDDDEDSQDKNYQLRFFRSDYADILDPPDPANGRYWIKIYNDTGSDIDWKFFATPTVDGGTLTVSRDKCGDYWCSIVVEDGKPNVSKTKIQEETAVGIDLGIKNFATLSDGTKYANPKYLERGQKKLKRLQQKLARTDKQSKRHEVMRLKVARQHRKIANQRTDYLHKLSTDLIDRFDTICLEDLNVDGMIKNHHLARAIQSVSWSEFVRQLTYKCEREGKNLVFIGRFDPSSQICHKCGNRNKDVKNLNVREWTCPICGEHHDRDVNAAKNILQFGLHPQALVAIENKIPQGSGIKDGEGNVIGHPVKRQYNKSSLSGTTGI